MNKEIRSAKWLVAAATLQLIAGPVAAQTKYQKPPQAILDVLTAPAPPNVFLSPTNDVLILATRVRYPPITDLARPMLRVAGVRIDPTSNNVHGAPYWSEYVLVRVEDGKQTRVLVPAGARLSVPRFSADGKRFAFASMKPAGVELWVGDAASGQVKRLPGVQLNPVLGDDLQWMPDQRTLLVKLVAPRRGPPPPASGVPEGPKVQESAGQTVASSTYEARDLLRTPHDATLFDYYATSQVALVDAATGRVSPLGKRALYTGLRSSPDGQSLLVQQVHRPYSYLSGYERFAHEVEIWSRTGALVHKVASLPLADSVPIRGVRTGPRDFEWRPTAPATLVWAEALDGGDWKKTVPHRDRLMTLSAPFKGDPRPLLEIDQRFAGIEWAETGGWALVTEVDLNRQWRRTSVLDVDGAHTSRVLWDMSMDERYKNPGAPTFRILRNGFAVIEQSGDSFYTAGAGASPQGDRPFLDRWNVRTLVSERLFRAGTTGFEGFVSWLDVRAGRFLTRHESPTEPPNLFVRTLGQPVAKGAPVPVPAPGEATFASSSRAITHLTDPTPQLRGITKRLVTYKRPDGVPLSFTLYLPPGYKEGTRLPTVVWAYPLDYADPATAGQVTGSSQRFTQMGWPLHLFFLLDGYAVLDNPSMPVVGDPKKIYDTYLEQLVAGAKAAVDKAVAMGVTDPDRVGVTGHSHGGLMTANLLAHSDLFRAGIARSGAYNHTIRPFGFQNERRTYWEARDVYLKLSPMINADKIKNPLLIVHGEADVNPGTIPFQSELLYQAVRGTGGNVRLVVLPFESHGYTALESVEHTLYEMLTWFGHYVKNAPPRPAIRTAHN
jgi:dipeptidyl aminopeptidase/acylaminoacyl peptidase